MKESHDEYMDNFKKVHRELLEVMEHMITAHSTIQKQNVAQTLTIFSQYVQVTLTEF
jgi:hypothetical protein